MFNTPAAIFQCVRDNLKTAAIDIYEDERDGSLMAMPAEKRLEIPADGLLKQTQELLGDTWLNKIKDVNRDKPILIVGKDSDLVNLIVSYLHLTHRVIEPDYHKEVSTFEVDKILKGYIGRICFKEVICTGQSGEAIERNLFSQNRINHYLGGGGMLFLRGIGKHKEIFEHIAAKAEGSYYESGRGVLIISTDTTGTLPQELLKRYEPIYLEPQDTANTPQAKGVTPFPTPPGTQWHEVKISFIDGENVKISARHVTETRHYSQMGFRKGRSSKPVAAWSALITFKEKGCLKYSQIQKRKAEKTIQDLRKRLREYFGILGDPVVLEHGYKPIFRVYTQETESRSVHAYTNNGFFVEKEDD